jgi:Na+/phosphate symporter
MTDSKPGYLYQFTTDLGSGQTICVNGNMPVGITKEEINKEFDLIRGAMERQRAKSAVDGAKQRIERGESTLARLTTDIALMDARIGKRNITGQENEKRQNALASAEDLKKQIDKEKGDLEQLIKEAM